MYNVEMQFQCAFPYVDSLAQLVKTSNFQNKIILSLSQGFMVPILALLFFQLEEVHGL
jgi:hypothetical protein